MVTIAALIEKIENRQPVLNKSELADGVFSIVIQSIASFDNATSEHMVFLSQAKYANNLLATQAGVALVTASSADLVPTDTVAIVVASPYLAYASCSQLFLQSTELPNINAAATIADSATIGKGVSLGAGSVIGEHVVIGSGTHISANVTIESNCHIGDYCVIKPNVVIAEHTQIGSYVRIHAGASIGSEGFGFAPTANISDGGTLGGWERIAQLGRVIIGNHVRIGANTCIDRGAIDDTVIADNVIIDNLVQIAHNVHIGAGTAIAANSGVAGSTKIGKRCIIAGAVGIVGHLTIGDDVTITAMTLVTKSLDGSGTYSSGLPVMPNNDWKRAAVKFRQLGRK